MQLQQYLICTILFLFNKLILGKELPNFIPKCKLPSPDLEECFLKAADKMIPHFAKGIPEMNIRPFEPFYVPKVTLAQATQGGTYKCEFIDTYVSGLTNYKADSFKLIKFTPEEYHYFMNVSFENINIKSKYLINGTILLIPIHGYGQFIGNFSDVSGSAEILHKKTIIDGKTYYKIKTAKVKVNLQKNKNQLDFDTVKQGNEAIYLATEHFLKENIDFFIEDVIGPIEDIIKEIVKDILGKFFDFPMNVLFNIETQ